MRKPIASAVIIRGEGECQAYINGVVHQEMRRQQAKMRAEREHAHVVEVSRDRLLRQSLTEIRRKLYKRPNLLRRAWDSIVNAWAMGWAMLICYSLGLGLIEEVAD